MTVKLFEVRDSATTIPCIGIECCAFSAELKREYGTTRRAEVINQSQHVLSLIDEVGEGHLLLCLAQPGEHYPKGTKGTLTFTKGGPKGGFWKFKTCKSCPLP